MFERKVDPIWVLKGCIIILIGVFLFNFVFSSFSSSRAYAAGGAQASGVESPSFAHPDIRIPGSTPDQKIDIKSFIINIAKTTGIYAFISDMTPGVTPAGQPITVFGWHELIMVLVGFLVVYLGAAKGFEPLLLVPIGFGIIFVNIPFANMGSPGVWNEQIHMFEHQGFLNVIYNAGVGNEFFPLVIFIGIGAMTDFGPLIANPKTALLGAAAQLGVFGTFFFITLSNFIPGVNFNIKEACAVSIIGGADGPTTIYIAAKLAPHLLATVAVAAYSYMAMVPLIQPPVIRLLTTKNERRINMLSHDKDVPKSLKIAFPIVVTFISGVVAPISVPLIGSLMFGNLIRECGVVERLSLAAQNELASVVTILLGITIGSSMRAAQFLTPATIMILVLGLVAFIFDTAGGVLFAKFLNLFRREKINPMIGAAGISAFPMSARVIQKMATKEDPYCFVIMHSVSANVSGQLGSVIAGGIVLALVPILVG